MQTHSSKPLTLEDILKIGLGELGMDPDVLYDYSFEEFLLKLEGYRHAQLTADKNSWERMRELAFNVCAYTGNMKKGLTKYMFMPFTWDENKAGKSHIANLTGEERKEAARQLIEERQRHLNEFLNKRKN